MKLALGTVQFGMDYGISNTNGQVSSEEVGKILTMARSHNIDMLDTGNVYGSAEQVIGQQVRDKYLDFNIVDKVPDLETLGLTISDALKQSLERLQMDKLYGLMLHNAADLTDQTYKELCALKDQGLVDKIGISVYHPKPTFELEERYALDLVQLPMNLFDQRFFETGCLDWLKEKGVEIHARSIFLQGLLLMDFHQTPPYFHPYKPLFDKLNALCKQTGLSRLAASLTIAHQHNNIDRLVFGVCSVEQLEQVLQAYEEAAHSEFDSSELSCHEEGLISPFLWPDGKRK